MSTVALLPVVVAAEFGGVLWWTPFVAAVAILLAQILAIPGLSVEENSRLLRQHWLLALRLHGLLWLDSGHARQMTPNEAVAFSPFLRTMAAVDLERTETP